MTAIKKYQKDLTAVACQGENTGVETRENILLKTNLPDMRAELRSGDARRASLGPHISALIPGRFCALSAEG